MQQENKSGVMPESPCRKLCVSKTQSGRALLKWGGGGEAEDEGIMKDPAKLMPEAKRAASNAMLTLGVDRWPSTPYLHYGMASQAKLNPEAKGVAPNTSLEADGVVSQAKLKPEADGASSQAKLHPDADTVASQANLQPKAAKDVITPPPDSGEDSITLPPDSSKDVITLQPDLAKILLHHQILVRTSLCLLVPLNLPHV